MNQFNSSRVMQKKEGNMQTLWQDLRYDSRMLMKRPGFTLIAALTLAFAVCANTAFALSAHGVLAQPRHRTGGQSACPDAKHMQEVERGLDLNQLMRRRQIPGASVAVIDHYRIA